MPPSPQYLEKPQSRQEEEKETPVLDQAAAMKAMMEELEHLRRTVKDQQLLIDELRSQAAVQSTPSQGALFDRGSVVGTSKETATNLSTAFMREELQEEAEETGRSSPLRNAALAGIGEEAVAKPSEKDFWKEADDNFYQRTEDKGFYPRRKESRGVRRESEAQLWVEKKSALEQEKKMNEKSFKDLYKADFVSSGKGGPVLQSLNDKDLERVDRRLGASGARPPKPKLPPPKEASREDALEAKRRIQERNVRMLEQQNDIFRELNVKSGDRANNHKQLQTIKRLQRDLERTMRKLEDEKQRSIKQRKTEDEALRENFDALV